MKYFYRLEHKEARTGPYSTNVKNSYSITVAFIVSEELKLDIYHADNTPTPYQDGLGEHTNDDRNGDSRFGFQSMAKLKKWFSKDKRVYEIMEENDIVLARYVVEERFDSKFQSVAYIGAMNNRVVLPFSKLNLDTNS